MPATIAPKSILLATVGAFILSTLTANSSHSESLRIIRYSCKAVILKRNIKIAMDIDITAVKTAYAYTNIISGGCPPELIIDKRNKGIKIIIANMFNFLYASHNLLHILSITSLCTEFPTNTARIMTANAGAKKNLKIKINFSFILG